MRLDGFGSLRIGTGEPSGTAKLDVGGALKVDGPYGSDFLAVSSGPASIVAGATSCDATGGSFTVELPSAVGIAGRRFFVKRINSGANTVTVDGDSTETIDGMSSQRLDTQWAAITVVSNGATWIIESQMGTVTGIP